MQWKMHPNPPAVCPRCGSTEQRTDQEREAAYMREVYGPIATIVGGVLKKKSGPTQ